MPETYAMTIGLTLPPELLPNAQRRLSWRVWGPIARDVRRDAGLLLRPADAGWTPLPGPVAVTYAVAWPRGRRMPDLDATAHALKPVQDALADAGIITDDRQIVSLTVRQTRGHGDVGWIVVELLAGAAEEQETA